MEPLQKATKPAPNKGAYKEFKKAPFLDAYRKYGVIWRAARRVGISRDAVHDWRKRDIAFAREFEEAYSDTTDSLEHSAIKMALGGNTGLLIFMLKARNPEKYSERYKHRISDKLFDSLLPLVVGAIKRQVPTCCNHCGKDLQIRESLAVEFKNLATKICPTSTSTVI